LGNEHKTDENKIRGCISNLWVGGEVLADGTMEYYHDADSHMTKGTAKVILDMVNGEPKEEVAGLTIDSFKPLGIRELLTMQRQVGFAGLIERVVQIAKNK
jgi:cysteine desulfuration protein SufE